MTCAPSHLLPERKVNRNTGRPLAEFNWSRVDELLIAGSPGTEIAGYFGICADTLYKRCEKEKGMTFSAYLQQKRFNGEALLREVQFKKALDGDNTMLVWLGKDRLKQRDKEESSLNLSAEDLEKISNAIKSHIQVKE